MISYLGFFVALRLEVAAWLLLSEALFFGKLNKRSRFPLRLVASVTGMLIIATIVGAITAQFLMNIGQLGIRLDRAQLFPFLNVLTHAILFATAYFVMRICFDEERVTVLFCTIAAYSCCHVTLGLPNLIFGFFGVSNIRALMLDHNYLLYLVSLVLQSAVFLGIWYFFIRSLENIAEAARMNKLPTMVLFAFALLVVIAVQSFSSNQKRIDMMVFSLISISNLSFCVIILYIQSYIIQRVIREKEQDFLLNMSRMRAEQYRITKENMDIINIKCHDLKHQLMALRSNKSIDSAYLDKLSESVNIYNAAATTGNEALDTVLTDKGLFCSQNGISLTYMANGDVISFLDTADIYSLFGNALDNAIEHLMTLPEDKRILKVFVGKKDAFVRATISNYYEGKPLTLVNGLPKTTKADTAFHGYGTKSIRQIAERYGGNLSILTEGNQFVLSVLFPHSANPASK